MSVATTPSGATTTRPADAVRLTVLLATGIPTWSAMAPPADWPQVRAILNPNRPLRSGA